MLTLFLSYVLNIFIPSYICVLINVAVGNNFNFVKVYIVNGYMIAVPNNGINDVVNPLMIVIWNNRHISDVHIWNIPYILPKTNVSIIILRIWPQRDGKGKECGDTGNGGGILESCIEGENGGNGDAGDGLVGIGGIGIFGIFQLDLFDGISFLFLW